jgi:predicted phosphodiesterase
MRIAAITDIHGNLPALEAVLAEIAHEGVDATVNLGDILSGPLWPAETADRLMPLNLPTLAGNHERQLLTQALKRMSPTDHHTALRLSDAHRRWLASLPPVITFSDEVFLCHGTPTSDLQYFLETVVPGEGEHGSPGVRAATAGEITQRLGGVRHAVVLCGHTHMPRIAGAGATLIVNPGSVGLPAFDDDHIHFHRIEAGSPHARWALVERGAAGWSAQLRATAYDWEAAARQAETHGRGDWADALRSGRVGRLESQVTA